MSVIYSSASSGVWRYDRLTKLAFGTGTLRLENDGGGAFSTAIPISPADYRKRHPTKATVKYQFKESPFRSQRGRHHFIVTDDWGGKYGLLVDDTDDVRPLVEAALARAKEDGLLRETQEPSAGRGEPDDAQQCVVPSST